MAVGTALRFQRDDLGRPRVMYIRDCLAACRVCGHELIQRAWDQVSYHHLTAARFRALAAAAAERLDPASCEQCAEPVEPAQVVRWTLTYGFPQDSGLIQAFGRRGPDGPVIEYALSPHRRFDAQMLPEWEPEDDQSVARSAGLTEDWLRPVFGRYFSLKAGWRRALGSWEESAAGYAAFELASGCYGLLAGSEAGLWAGRARIAAVGQAPAEEDWVAFELGDAITELLDEGPHAWLPTEWFQRLADGAPRAIAMARISQAETLLRSALAGLPGPTECEVGADGLARVGFPLGDEGIYNVELSLPELLGEAMLTGSAPGDWVGLWLDDRLVELAAGSPTGAD